MNYHDQGTHNGLLLGFTFDSLKGKRSKSSSIWVRFGQATLRLILIGLLMASPFILLIALIMIFACSALLSRNLAQKKDRLQIHGPGLYVLPN
jgi:hypothetical protein